MSMHACRSLPAAQPAYPVFMQQNQMTPSRLIGALLPVLDAANQVADAYLTVQKRVALESRSLREPLRIVRTAYTKAKDAATPENAGSYTLDANDFKQVDAYLKSQTVGFPDVDTPGLASAEQDEILWGKLKAELEKRSNRCADKLALLEGTMQNLSQAYFSQLEMLTTIQSLFSQQRKRIFSSFVRA